MSKVRTRSQKAATLANINKTLAGLKAMVRSTRAWNEAAGRHEARNYGSGKRRASSVPTRKRASSSAPFGNPSGRKPYFTHGKAAKRFKKARRVKRSKYRKLGSEFRYEIGGVLEDNQCVYVGHSTTGGEHWIEMFCRNIVRDLYRMKGTEFASWEQDWIDNMEWRIIYFLDIDSTTSESVISFQNNDSTSFGTTYAALAQWMGREIHDRFKADHAVDANIHKVPQFKEFLILNGVDVEARIRAGDYYHTFCVESTLLLQNRSLATASTVDPTRYLVNDVSNNPLIGRQYIGKGAGFYPKRREDPQLNYQSFFPDLTEGVILAESAHNMPDDTQKPVPGTYFKNCKKSSRVTLNPGAIKKHFLKTMLRMSCQRFNARFLNAWLTYSLGTTPPIQKAIQLNVGNCAMFGLEKLLNSRRDEGLVSVAWELNQTFKCYGHYNKYASTAPITSVGSVETRPTPDPV